MVSVAKALSDSPFRNKVVFGQDDAYPRFASIMDHYGYDWEAFLVHTEDHYILSTFHVTGKRLDDDEMRQ